MARCKNNPALFERADAGAGTAMAGRLALAHFNKHGGAIRRLHDQIDFATPAPRRPIIAHQQAQAGLLQKMQRGLFGRITRLLGRTGLGLDLRKNH